MSISTVQLNLSHSTLEEIALNALPLLQALGLELDEAAISKVGQAPVLHRRINVVLPFGPEDVEPLITWF